MKKWMTWALLPAMVLGLCSCGKKKDAEIYQGLQIGYGRVDITPAYPVNLAGSASNRVSTGTLDPLYMTCIALRQSGETFLMVTMDLVGTYETFAAPVRTVMSKATGIGEDHIILNSTHTHASVSANNDALTGITQYRQDLNSLAAEVATAALEDLSAAEVWYGSTQTQGMAWVRHYKMADGTYAGPNYGSFSSGIVGHASDADGEMQLVRFVRPAADKKDVVLMNFPAHATMNQSGTQLSADFPGPAREYVARSTDTLVAYFIAAGGDQVPSSRLAEETFSKDYNVYGEELGRIAVDCLSSLTKQESTQLSFSQRTFTGKSNKEELDRLDEAKAVQAIWEQVGGRGTDAGKKAAKEHGFSSVYEVTAILNREHFEENRSMELKALSLGDISFIFAPYEMFGSNGKQIKEASPFSMTFIVTCSYNHAGYLPSELGWQIRCYEAQITKFARGTAESLVGEYVDMLTKLKNP